MPYYYILVAVQISSALLFSMNNKHFDGCINLLKEKTGVKNPQIYFWGFYILFKSFFLYTLPIEIISALSGVISGKNKRDFIPLSIAVEFSFWVLSMMAIYRHSLICLVVAFVIMLVWNFVDIRINIKHFREHLEELDINN